MKFPDSVIFYFIKLLKKGAKIFIKFILKTCVFSSQMRHVSFIF